MFLIDNIFVEIKGHIFQQISGIPMRSTVDLSLPIFFYNPMKQSLCNYLSKTKTITEAKAYDITFRYIDDDLPINDHLCTSNNSR